MPEVRTRGHIHVRMHALQVPTMTRRAKGAFFADGSVLEPARGDRVAVAEKTRVFRRTDYFRRCKKSVATRENREQRECERELSRCWNVEDAMHQVHARPRDLWFFLGCSRWCSQREARIVDSVLVEWKQESYEDRVLGDWMEFIEIVRHISVMQMCNGLIPFQLALGNEGVPRIVVLVAPQDIVRYRPQTIRVYTVPTYLCPDTDNTYLVHRESLLISGKLCGAVKWSTGRIKASLRAYPI